MHVIDTAEVYDLKQPCGRRIRAVWEDIRRDKAKARFFVFDAEASAFAGRFIREHGLDVLRNRQFAIPPFLCTYIEYNLDALLNAIGRRSTRDLLPDAERDERVSHLIVGDHVRTFIEGSDGKGSYFPVDMTLNSQGHVRGRFDKDLHTDRYRKLAYTLGSTANDVRDEAVLRDWLTAVDYHPLEGFEVLLTNKKLADCATGTARNLIALLLILNRQRTRIEMETVARRGVIFKGKRRVQAEHTMVRLDVEAYETIARSYRPGGGHHESPRRHQVRGFFRHYHQVRGCDHAYVPIPAREGAWVCPKCSTVRVWVADHERGDASKGYVVKEYAVIDSKGS